MIVGVGLSPKNAPIEVRVKLAVSPSRRSPEVLDQLTASAAVGEAVVLSTCNRVEIYAVRNGRRGATDDELRAAAAGVVLSVAPPARRDAILPYSSTRCRQARLNRAPPLPGRRLPRPSLVVGDARRSSASSRTPSRSPASTSTAPDHPGQRAMHRAVRVGKRVRTETAIGVGAGLGVQRRANRPGPQHLRRARRPHRRPHRRRGDGGGRLQAPRPRRRPPPHRQPQLPSAPRPSPPRSAASPARLSVDLERSLGVRGRHRRLLHVEPRLRDHPGPREGRAQGSAPRAGASSSSTSPSRATSTPG